MFGHRLLPAVLTLTLLVLVPVVRAQASGDLIAQGATVYSQNCASCHGNNAAGGISFGTISSADIRGYHLTHALSKPYTTATLETAILKGIDQNGQALNGAMPRWQGMLSQGQVTALITYLQSLGPLHTVAQASQRGRGIPHVAMYMLGAVAGCEIVGVSLLRLLDARRTP